ncbi:lipid-binding SYLF domain-containing protein [Flavitalea sp.]|nr:YSC84-related protein [Flavitalea sp.]
MKYAKNNFVSFLLLVMAFLPGSVFAQDNKERIMGDSKNAKEAFIKTDPGLKKWFTDSYGYVIFPNVGKGGVIVGGAGGNGTVYEKGQSIGTANMVQATVGAQVGGKAYREVIFFETKDALDRFRENKFEFSSQIAAVALKSGVSANAKYTEGVAVFTEDKGGLMAEVSVGGQKFTFKSL